MEVTQTTTGQYHIHDGDSKGHNSNSYGSSGYSGSSDSSGGRSSSNSYGGGSGGGSGSEGPFIGIAVAVIIAMLFGGTGCLGCLGVFIGFFTCLLGCQGDGVVDIDPLC